MKQNIPIAIIGMGCFFPKSSGLKQYWRLLFHGEDAITDMPDSHWSPEDYYDADPGKPDHVYCKRGGFLSPISFDPTEFAIPPSSLEGIDTAQLLSLVVAKKAIEDAGYGEETSFNRDRVSVILGATGTQELVIPLGARLGHPKWLRALKDAGVPADKAAEVIERISDSYVSWQENSFPGLLGNVIAGRICNRLDLGGTNCVVDAACASSMSAIHLAVMELCTNKSDMVVTGGVDALNDIFMHMCFSETQTLSPTGDARPFSKDADGTVLGEGIGMLILKRLKDAEKDGNRIYAVLKAIGSSSDGKSQSIYAPRKEGQIKALRIAYENAGVDPTTVGLIEGHGTGTRVGDIVEFQALTQFFSNRPENADQCALGSVKSMIGHTKAAAGAAGLIKSALALYNKVLPPTLKADEPNSNMDIDESPFYLCTETRPWFSKKGHPRRSGVSAFGFGGSNFHIVLEEHRRDKQEISWDGSIEIIALSAPTQSELTERLRSLINDIEKGLSHEEMSLKAAKTRHDFSSSDPHRILFAVEQPLDPPIDSSGIHIDLYVKALETLESNPGETAWHAKNIYCGGPEQPGKIAFIFPGQGSQYVGMGRDLICSFPDAFKILERANEKLKGPKSLSDFIYPYPARTQKAKKNQEEDLKHTHIAQPALGAVSLSMLKILQGFGIRPDATCGHSFGELTALCAAGWMDTDALLDLAVSRGAAMASAGRNTQQTGTMLAVKAPLEALDALVTDIDSGIVLANRNAPNQGVLSGPLKAITLAEQRCKENGFRSIRLPVSAAFHSDLVKDARKPFMKSMGKINISPSDIPVFSNTTSRPYPADPVKPKQILCDQILHPVNFVEEIENMFDSGIRTFVEIGPKTVLTGLVKSILKDRDVQVVAMDSSSGKGSGMFDLAKTLCHLASRGYPVNLTQWEQPVSEPRKQIMSIPIQGANYRNPKPEVRRQKTEKIVQRKKETIRTSETKERDFNRKMESKNKPQQSESILNALKTVQEGLKSMQALQMQTAEAHKKFLETQTEAGRTLQKMMDSTRHLAEISLGIKTEFKSENVDLQNALESASRSFDNNASTTQAENRTSIVPDIQELPRQQPVSSDPPRPTAAEAPFQKPDLKPDHQHFDQEKIETNILEVVGQLTGYPKEMLDLTMDIESDLGIDSIKRVEILSTLEEKMPDLPAVSPEIMGKLKTLGQIAEYLSGASKREVPIQDETPDPKETVNINSSVDPKELEDHILEVVGRLTGYPLEMLELGMDIESDLGIDSIKRVEILSAIEEKMPDLPAVSPEIMGKLKTLGQIAEYLSGPPSIAGSDSDTEASAPPSDSIAGAAGKDPVCSSKELSSQINRNIVSIVDYPALNKGKLSIPKNRTIYVTDDHTGLGEAIVDEFVSKDINATLIPGESIPDVLNSGAALKDVAGLVILYNKTPDDVRFLKNAFLLAKQVAPDLFDSAGEGGAFLATVTRLDGAFGFKGKGVLNPMQGGLAGLVKTASLEWDTVCCRAIDLTPDWKENRDAANAVVAELLYPDLSGPVEIGLGPGERSALELELSPYPEGQIDLAPDDVVVITGGARGITASAAMALAKHNKPTLVLMGRSPAPQSEPGWLSTAEDEASVKKAIFENEFKNKNASPIQIEEAFKKHMANREIFRNLEKINKIGATALYYSVDVCDVDKVNSVLDDVRSSHGPIAGIIHGAGLLKDRRIVDKTVEQFNTVFETKVKGLNVLLEAVKQDKLKYLVLFSSVTARFGNSGQVDYAMANEVLNKMAQHESFMRPDCKVTAINWGPWDGGMVCSALKRKFERDAVELIPMDTGALCMVYEMMGDKSMPAEIIIGPSIHPKAKTSPHKTHLRVQKQRLPEEKENKLSLTLKREIDVDRYPILEAHVLGGKPVVPFALITEWLGHGALHENPGLLFHGLDNIRLLKGIKLDGPARTIRLMAGKARKKGSIFEVDVEIRDGVKNNVEVIHSRATAILTDELEKPPVFYMSDHIRSNAYSRGVEEIYEKILFHGFELRGIQEIIGCSSQGIAARVSSAPSPAKWMTDPLRSKWIGDPLVLDAAFQMAIVWCFEEKGVLSLPSFSASYRQYCSRYPSEGVTAVLEVKQATDHKMIGDFMFLDRDGGVIAQLTGYEAVMDTSLSRAFKSRSAA